MTTAVTHGIGTIREMSNGRFAWNAVIENEEGHRIGLTLSRDTSAEAMAAGQEALSKHNHERGEA